MLVSHFLGKTANEMPLEKFCGPKRTHRKLATSISGVESGGKHMQTSYPVRWFRFLVATRHSKLAGAEFYAPSQLKSFGQMRDRLTTVQIKSERVGGCIKLSKHELVNKTN